MFIQVGCLVPADAITGREVKGLVLACCAVFVSLFIINFLDYVKKIQENNYIEWDIKTVTAGDYTIEFDITPKFFQTFLDKEYEDFNSKAMDDGIDYVTPQEAFKDWITKEMQSRLDRMPDLGLEDEPVKEIKIAKTTMAFKNSEVIGLLK